MFNDFTPIKGSLYKQRVNTGVGIVFLSSVALWAALVVLNFASGHDPITHAIGAFVQYESLGE